MTISLSNRLALVFSAITFLAIGALYVYVAPGLETRLIGEKLSGLATAARHDSGPIIRTVGAPDTLSAIKAKVDSAALASGSRVTLMSVSVAAAPAGGQLSPLADSSNPSAAARLGFPVAHRAVATATLRAGTERAAGGTVAEAAYPVIYQGRVVRVIVYSDPVSDIVRNVSTVRHEILVAGGIALLLALIGGYVVARALARR
ncbi:MAG TPA: hypothetical protein VIM18_01440, partial [Solirubrobacteraceae bacterium]